MTLSGGNLCIYDTREHSSRAARWVKTDDEYSHILQRDSGNCDSILLGKYNKMSIYDLTAGKLRYMHEINALQGFSTYGKQIGVLQYGNDGNVAYYSWDNFEAGSYYTSRSQVVGSGGNFIALNAKGVYRTQHNNMSFGAWFQTSDAALVDQQAPVAAAGK